MADKALVPTEAITPSGYTISVEPVEVFDYKEKDAFLSALWQAVERGNPSVPNPPDNEIIKDSQGFPGFKNPTELKYAGVANWEEFERKSIYASIATYPSGYVVDVFGRATDGTWSDDIVLNQRVEVELGLAGVVDVILEHLQTRTDLPGPQVNK